LATSDGFFEWKRIPDGKIPYSIGIKDNSPFVFPGLWEGWKDPANREWLHTCTIITGEPNEFLRENPQPDAGHPTGRASRILAIWMSVSLFGEGGPHDIRRTGQHTYTINVSFPKDSDGRTARACPSTSCLPSYFKIKNGTVFVASRKRLIARIADAPLSRVTF
jgi:SOS response associated peptidase (SRAP)